jgi:hypothetical protein
MDHNWFLIEKENNFESMEENYGAMISSTKFLLYLIILIKGGWLIDCCLMQVSNFSAISWHFNEMVRMSTLYEIQWDGENVHFVRDSMRWWECPLVRDSMRWWECPLCTRFNEMVRMSTLYETNIFSWIFKRPAHWNNSPQLDMLLHSDILSWSWANQSSLLLLNAVCSAVKQQILIL